MAKRKRLTPPRPGYLEEDSVSTEAGTGQDPGSGGRGRAPIAQVAGDASAHVALHKLSEALETARARGLMIAELPLSAIDEGHLIRDRIIHDDDEMTVLMDSLRKRGQQTPIEVVALAETSGPRTYGLISGWRRMAALHRLNDVEKGDRFATVKAVVIQPKTAQSAYVSMVEENEIRVNLSFYERARIVLRTLHEGVYPTQKAALQGLFGNVQRAKRSKIGSFITVVEALDGVLRHPAAISEKLGLALARRLTNDPGFAHQLTTVLIAAPRDTPKSEISLLSAAVTTPEKMSLNSISETEKTRVREMDAGSSERQFVQVNKGLRIAFMPSRNRIEVQGHDVTDSLVKDLSDWLRRR